MFGTMHSNRHPSRPSVPPDLTLRASDHEREAVVEALREHAGAGRLDVDELAERLDTAWAARTRADLDRLTRDLPGAARHRRTGRPTERGDLQRHAVSYALTMVVLVAIWALTGAGYFWPVWPMLGWGIGVASHAAEARGLPMGRAHRGCASSARRLAR